MHLRESVSRRNALENVALFSNANGLDTANVRVCVELRIGIALPRYGVHDHPARINLLTYPHDAHMIRASM